MDDYNYFEMDDQTPADYVTDVALDLAVTAATDFAFPDTREDDESHHEPKSPSSPTKPKPAKPKPDKKALATKQATSGTPATRSQTAATVPHDSGHTNRWKRLRSAGRRVRERKILKRTSIATLIVVLLLLPDSLYTVYVYFYSYVQVNINTRATVNVYRNDNTQNAFYAFFWILALLCSIVNGLAGCGLVAGCWKIAEEFHCHPCAGCLWMIPWVLAAMAMKSVTFWAQVPIQSAMENDTWNNACNNFGVSAVLVASTYTNLAYTLPNVGQVNITSSDGQVNCTLDLNRDDSDHSLFQFQVVQCSGTVSLPYDLILYDTRNNSYSAISNSSSGANTSYTNGSYSNEPLTFRSLNLFTFDEYIPFVRPGYDGCWPAAATLINPNSTSSTPILKSIAFDPSSGQNLLVCGTMGSQAAAFQISLGVVHVTHFQYSLCTSASGSVESMGDGQGN